MKPKAIFLSALLLLAPVLVAAQSVTTKAAATEVFDPLNVFGNGAVGTFLNFGEVTCPGTQPTGNPMQPCPPGSRIEIRGTALKSRLVSDDANLTGWLMLQGSANMTPDGTGQFWGKFRLELDAGGTWEGSWTSKRTQVESYAWVGRIQGVGQGTAGCVEGMQLRFKEAIYSFSPLMAAYFGSMDAQMLAPPSQ